MSQHFIRVYDKTRLLRSFPYSTSSQEESDESSPNRLGVVPDFVLVFLAGGKSSPNPHCSSQCARSFSSNAPFVSEERNEISWVANLAISSSFLRPEAPLRGSAACLSPRTCLRKKLLSSGWSRSLNSGSKCGTASLSACKRPYLVFGMTGAAERSHPCGGPCIQHALQRTGGIIEVAWFKKGARKLFIQRVWQPSGCNHCAHDWFPSRTSKCTPRKLLWYMTYNINFLCDIRHFHYYQ